MARTLKEQYSARQLDVLKERTRTVDAQLIKENRAAALLLEALDEEDLKKVTAIIEKLRNIKTPDLPHLTQAIEQAEAEINKYTAGGPLTAAWTKLKGLVGVDNPIVKITTFANALEKGFSQIPNILKNNGIDLSKVDLEQSLAANLGRLPTAPKAKPSRPTGAVSDKELGNTKFAAEGQEMSEDSTADAQAGIKSKIESITAQLQKALAPGGVFGAFKKVPYIDSAALAKELVQAKLRAFSTVAKAINSGTKTSEVGSDMQSMLQGGKVQTKTTAPSGESQPAAAAKGTSPTKDTTTTSNSTPTGQAPPEAKTNGAQANASAAVSKIAKGAGVDEPTALKILKYLNQSGLLDREKLASH